MIKQIHEKIFRKSRDGALTDNLIRMIPKNTTLLDIGCGDGRLDHYIISRRPDVSIKGIDPIIRKKTYGDVTKFDGKTIPFDEGSFETVMLVNVLHHADEPRELFKESVRVSSKYLLIKDHIAEGLFAWQTLCFMDWVSNKKHGVNLPYKFLTRDEWAKLFELGGVRSVEYTDRLVLYPVGFNWIFSRGLHFIGLYQKNK